MFMRKILNSVFSAAIVSVVLLSASGYTHAGIEDEMNDMFGSMSNVTNPGSYKSSRRGVLSGGRVQVRNKIMNTDIIALDAPSFEMGCGGINFYGGSFSFINKEKFIQLLRSIASNAAGFSFSIALRAMSQEVAGTMETIQKKIQKFNEFFGNSCQLAKGMVTGTKSAVQKAWNNEASLGKSIKDGASDLYGSFTNDDGSGGPAKDPDPDTEETLTGNLIWNALNEHNAMSWWKYGDDNMMELIMSASGTFIVEISIDQAAPATKAISGKAPTLLDLVKGGTFEYLKCDTDDKCMAPEREDITIEGFEKRIEEMFLGDGSANKGILKKLKLDNESLIASEEAFLAALPNGLGGMVFRLSRVDIMMASNFVSGATEVLAIQMSYDLMEAMLGTASATLAAAKENAYSAKAQQLIVSARARMYQQYQALMANADNISESVKTYNAILQAVGNNYVAPTYQAPGR